MALDFTSIATGLFSTQAAGTALPKLETQLPSLQGLGNLVELDTAGGHATGHEPIKFKGPLEAKYAQVDAQKKAIETLRANATKLGTTADEAIILNHTAAAKAPASHLVNGIADIQAHAANFDTELQGIKDAVISQGVATNKVAEAKAIVAHLDTEASAARAFVDKSKNFATTVTTDVQALAPDLKGVSSVGAAVGAAASTAPGAKIFVNHTAAQELGVIGQKAYDGKSFVGRIMANVKANFNVHSIDKAGEVTKSGFLGKTAKAGGAGLGAIIVGYGLKDAGQVMGIVGADTDEKGQEIPSDSGKLIKAVGELGAGAAAIYFTLLKGGKAAGIGA